MLINKIREANGISQQQLANYLGTSKSFVNKLENGEEPLNATFLDMLCNLFQCDEECLFSNNSKYKQLNVPFDKSNLQTEDLKCIATMNRIVMNLKFMNYILKEGDEIKK